MLGVSPPLLALPEIHIPTVKSLVMATQCINFSHNNLVWQIIWYDLKYDKKRLIFLHLALSSFSLQGGRVFSNRITKMQFLVVFFSYAFHERNLEQNVDPFWACASPKALKNHQHGV